MKISNLGIVSSAALILLAATAHAGPTAGPRITATPAVALYGEPFTWKVTGLSPGARVTVRAVAVDARKMNWSSEAVFEADASGAVDLSARAPVSGDYSGVDPFGLLWSMKAGGAKPGQPVAYRKSANGWSVDLTATDADGRTSATRFRCAYQRPGEELVRVQLEQDGLAGVLYRPAGRGPFPGVILLGGADGGLSEPLVRALASHGFATLALAYFNFPGVPDELVEIPLESFDRAIAWMKAQPAVAPRRLALLGGSKGAEAALLVAARNRDVRAVVAWTPTAHAWEGHTKRFYSPDYRPASSWSVGGQPVPYLGFEVSPEVKEKERRGELASFLDYFQGSLDRADAATLERAAIPVERIAGPILLVSATDDRIWPAESACATIRARLERAGFRHEVRHVSLEGGGHNAFLPDLVTAGRGLLVDGDPSGGSPQADAHGGYRSWAEMLDFLHRHLGR